MRRLIIVYNPRSSQAARVKAEVLEPARRLQGWTVGKYAVRATNVDDNAARLARILAAGDLVVVAGGDGTATIGVNGVMKSGVEATLAVLGYGNFNDHARTWQSGRNLAEIVERFESGSWRKLYPLEVLLDSKHWRWAACYFSVGMFAESTGIFEEPQVRRKLQKRRLRLVFSVLELASWYFRHKRDKFVPNCRVNGVETVGISDVLAVNSPRVAKMMRGGKYFAEPKSFLMAKGKLTSFGRLVSFMTKSVFHKIPGEKVNKLEIEFKKSEEVVIQAEGESAKTKVQKIEVMKYSKYINLV